MFALHPDGNFLSTQTGAESCWQEGRQRDMDAFDRLPRMVRDWLNQNAGFYAVEDVLYEHLNDHRGDAELTMVWLLEGEEMSDQMDLMQMEIPA